MLLLIVIQLKQRPLRCLIRPHVSGRNQPVIVARVTPMLDLAFVSGADALFVPSIDAG
jgi:hypothetical protein